MQSHVFLSQPFPMVSMQASKGSVHSVRNHCRDGFATSSGGESAQFHGPWLSPNAKRNRSSSMRRFYGRLQSSGAVKGQMAGSALLIARTEAKWHKDSVVSGSKRSILREAFLVKATATPREMGASLENSSSLEGQEDATSSALAWVDAFVRFSRPHTIIGTTLSIISVSLLAVESAADLNTRFIMGVLQALVPALCMNIYIVGLNQLFDIEIDKVNKPYLPLASGEYSVGTGIAIVAITAALSLAMGIFVGSKALLLTLTVSMILGTAYSIDLPLLRWKKVPMLAAGCILAIRAIVVQLGFYAHMKFTFGRAASMTRPLAFATSFMCLFSIVIALFKDIPDVEGDREFGVESFTVQLGQSRIFWICITTLIAAYAGGVAVGLASPVGWSKIFTVVCHAGAAGLLIQRARAVDLSSQESIYAAYMFVWKLFYAEYLLLPFVR